MLNLLYRLIRPVLFLLDPETAHKVSLRFLRFYYVIARRSSVIASAAKQSSYKDSGLLRCARNDGNSSGHSDIKIFDLSFPNKIGLAAGFDKDGEYIDALSQLGFGFIEVGTVTPKPQPGNSKPRLFRITSEQAIVNRMGFNNKGVDNLINNLKKTKYSGILGINIGKNYFTEIHNAVKDYLFCLEKVYTYADYIVCNISSPNTENLRDLQSDKYFADLFLPLKNKQQELAEKYNKYVPLVVKIAPDLNNEEIINLAKNIKKYKLDGVIATNTTLDRDVLKNKDINYQGGISGAPLFNKSNNVIKILREHLSHEIPIIGVGGIMTKEDIKTKLAMGADLVQIYSGFIFNGPKIICESHG